jgi:hypothetical protein
MAFVEQSELTDDHVRNCFWFHSTYAANMLITKSQGTWQFSALDIFPFDTSKYYCTHTIISAVFWGLFKWNLYGVVLGEGVEAIKNCPHGHWGRHPVDCVCKQLPGLLLELLHHWGLDILSDSNLWPFSTFLKGPKCMEVTWWQVWAVWGMVQHLPVHRVQHVLDSKGHMEMGIVVQHDNMLMSMPGYFTFMAVPRSRFHSSTVHWWWCQGPRVPASVVPWFSSDKDIKAMVVQWFQLQLREFFAQGIRQLLCQWNACLSARGGCIFNSLYSAQNNPQTDFFWTALILWSKS